MSSPAASMPRQSAFDRIAKRRPCGLGWRLSISATSKRPECFGPERRRNAERRRQTLCHSQSTRLCGNHSHDSLRDTTFHHDDWFMRCYSTSCREKRTCIHHVPHEEGDAVSMAVFAEVPNQIAPADICHRTHRDNRAEAMFLFVPHPRTAVSRTPPRLSNAMCPGRAVWRGKTNVDSNSRVRDTSASRTDYSCFAAI